MHARGKNGLASIRPMAVVVSLMALFCPDAAWAAESTFHPYELRNNSLGRKEGDRFISRAERSTWRAIETHGTEPGDAKGEGGVNAVCAAYLNRLSDLLFILARVANLDAGGDVLWQPGGGRVADPRTKKTPSA